MGALGRARNRWYLDNRGGSAFPVPLHRERSVGFGRRRTRGDIDSGPTFGAGASSPDQPSIDVECGGTDRTGDADSRRLVPGSPAVKPITSPVPAPSVRPPRSASAA